MKTSETFSNLVQQDLKSLTRGGKRYDFQIERGGNPNLAWIGAMNLKILLCFFTQSVSCITPKRNGIFVYLFFDIMLCHKEKFKTVQNLKIRPKMANEQPYR